MKRSIHVVDGSDLPKLLDFVHDCRYSLSEIRSDPTTRTLSLEVGLRSKALREGFFSRLLSRRGVVRGTLAIYGVVDFELDDQAEVGEGDINVIEYDGTHLLIQGGLPVRLRVRVDRLDIRLEIPEGADVA